MQRSLRMLPVVNSVIGNYRSVHLSSVYLSEVRRSKRDLAYRESEVLAVLTQNARVRVQLSPNLPELLVKSLSLSQSETVEVESSLVKNLLYKEGVTLSLINDQEIPPVVLVEPIIGKKHIVTTSNSTSPAKSKVLTFRSIIDDHMMDVKVRQASEFVAKGHQVTLIVRIPRHQIRRLENSRSLSTEEKLSTVKELYESAIRRFLNAFKNCSPRPPELIKSSDLKEFTIILHAQP